MIRGRLSHLAVFVLAVSLIAVGCQKAAPVDPAEAAGKLHLRAAMIALDKGDEKTAESELTQSLSADPMNNRARTTLASLYAKQSGLSLQDWLSPFWDAGRELQGRLHTVQQSSQMIDEVTADIDASAGADQESLGKKEWDIRQHVAQIAGDAAKISLGSSVLLDVFQSIPYLSDAQLVKLDKAIAVLRVDGVAPADRDEEQRVYLSVLSFVRLINHLKRILGDSPTYDINSQRDKVCALDIPTLKEQLNQIHISLTMLEEGLTISPRDPQTSQRAARAKVQEFVTSSLLSPAWDHLQDIFDPSTLDGQAAGLYSKRVCAKFNKTQLNIDAHQLLGESPESTLLTPPVGTLDPMSATSDSTAVVRAPVVPAPDQP